MELPIGYRHLPTELLVNFYFYIELMQDLFVVLILTFSIFVFLLHISTTLHFRWMSAFR